MGATAIVTLSALTLVGCSSDAAEDPTGSGGGATTSGTGNAAQGSGGNTSGQGGQTSTGQGGSGGAPEPANKSAGCGETQTAGFHCFDIMFEGSARNWCINIPESYDPDHAYELVIGLHGCGGNNNAVHSHRAPMEADGENEFIFVYPQAKSSCWDYISTPSPGNDMSFMAHMVSEAQASTCLDLDRTFVHGMSSGGSMAPRVVQAGLAIAFASASAGGTTFQPTAAWYYAGTTDGYYSTITSGINAQIAANGCDVNDTTPIPNTPCVRYGGCGDAPIVHCEDDRGHVWPSEDWAQGGILDLFRAVPR